MAIGHWAVGGFGVGTFSMSGCALAWKAAYGGVALAREFAMGGFALAPDANNDAAREFINSMEFFRVGFRLIKWLPLLYVLGLVPMFIWWRFVKKHNQYVRA